MESNEKLNSRVLILLSTFNGGEKIIRQVESIIAQKNVDIHIDIRDDGSNMSTLNILGQLKCKFPNRISVILGENLGWKKSFLELIKQADDSFDYYGFSDQDDIWFDNKIIRCIEVMNMDKTECPKLAHCNCLSVDEQLNLRSEQEKRLSQPKTFKMAISTEHFQGCGMLWNKKAMELIQRYYPENSNLAHDYWVGLICYFFGKIFHCSDFLFYHIRYGNNCSADGSKKAGRLKRLLTFFKSKEVYMNPASDLLRGYYQLLTPKQISFLKKCSSYKKNIFDKTFLFWDFTFKRSSFFSTILFKFAILFNKF